MLYESDAEKDLTLVTKPVTFTFTYMRKRKSFAVTHNLHLCHLGAITFNINIHFLLVFM